jgi:hypothetical protein
MSERTRNIIHEAVDFVRGVNDRRKDWGLGFRGLNTIRYGNDLMKGSEYDARTPKARKMGYKFPARASEGIVYSSIVCLASYGAYFAFTETPNQIDAWKISNAKKAESYQRQTEQVHRNRVDRFLPLATRLFGDNKLELQQLLDELQAKFKINEQSPDYKSYDEALKVSALQYLRLRIISSIDRLNKLQTSINSLESVANVAYFGIDIEPVDDLHDRIINVDPNKLIKEIDNLLMDPQKISPEYLEIGLAKTPHSLGTLEAIDKGFIIRLSVTDSNQEYSTSEYYKYLKHKFPGSNAEQTLEEWLIKQFPGFEIKIIDSAEESSSNDKQPIRIKLTPKKPKEKVSILPPNSLLAQVRQTRSSL